MTEKRLPAKATIYPTYVGGGRTRWKGDVVFNNNLTLFFDCRTVLNDDELYKAQEEILNMLDFSEEDFEEEFGHRRPIPGEGYHKTAYSRQFMFNPLRSLNTLAEARAEAQRVYDKHVSNFAASEMPYAPLEIDVLPDTAAYLRGLDDRKYARQIAASKKEAKAWFKGLFSFFRS